MDLLTDKAFSLSYAETAWQITRMTSDEEMIDIPCMSMSHSAHDAWRASPDGKRIEEADERMKSLPDAQRAAGDA